MTQTESIPRGPAIVIGVAALLLLADDLVPDGMPFDTDRVSMIAVLTIGIAVLVIVKPQALAARLKRAAPHLAVGLAVSTVTTMVMLVASEFLVRWMYRDVTTTADDRGYFTAKWNGEAVRFNSHGYRERPFESVKAAGTYRIAVMGDSFTFGNGIAEDERYSSLLQRGLGEGFEVLNFGLPGFNTPEIAWTLRRQVRAFNPDFILVQWFVNDVEGSGRLRPHYRALLPLPTLHEKLHRYSALYTLANTWWSRRQVSGQGGAESYAHYLTRIHADPHGGPALDDRRALREVLDAAQGVPVAFVLFPDFTQDLGDSYPFAFLHQRLMDFCGEMELTCLDLRPDFARIANRQSLWASRLDAHPGARANMIAADRIRQVFEPIWLTRTH